MARKLSISRAWDESREVLRRDGRLLLAVSLALVGVPVTLANFVIPVLRPGAVPAAGAWVLVVLLAFAVILGGVLAMVRLSVRSDERVGSAIRLGFVRLAPFIAAILLIFIPFMIAAAVLNMLAASGNAAQAQQTALGVLVLLFLVLGPLLSRFILAPSVAVAERAGPLAQLQRSWNLTSGNGLRLLGGLLLVVIAIAVLELAIGALFGSIIIILLGPPEPQSVSKLLLGMVLGLLRALELIVISVMLARLYLQRAGAAEAEVSVPSSGT